MIDVRIHLTGEPDSRRGVAQPEPIELVRERVRAARNRAASRWDHHSTRWHHPGVTNADIPTEVLRASRLPAPVTAPIERALRVGALSRRGAEGVLRIAWTAADLDGAGQPRPRHIAEAPELRQTAMAPRP